MLIGRRMRAWRQRAMPRSNFAVTCNDAKGGQTCRSHGCKRAGSKAKRTDDAVAIVASVRAGRRRRARCRRLRQTRIHLMTNLALPWQYRR